MAFKHFRLDVLYILVNLIRALRLQNTCLRISLATFLIKSLPRISSPQLFTTLLRIHNIIKLLFYLLNIQALLGHLLITGNITFGNSFLVPIIIVLKGISDTFFRLGVIRVIRRVVGASRVVRPLNCNQVLMLLRICNTCLFRLLIIFILDVNINDLRHRILLIVILLKVIVITRTMLLLLWSLVVADR